MSQPIIKYTLTKQGRQPEWLSKDSRAFKGQHGTSANKAGKLPRYGSPQNTIYLGIGAGEPDSDGTPMVMLERLQQKQHSKLTLLELELQQVIK